MSDDDEYYEGRNKELEEHIKNTPNAGKHRKPSRSSERIREREKLDEIQQAVNNGEDIENIYYED